MIPIEHSGLEDKPVEACGVFGVFGHEQASALCALGLHALQHRGQEGAGIASVEGKIFHLHRAPGLVGDVFDQKTKAIDDLPGSAAIGHVRYATSGGEGQQNLQPLFAELDFGGFAISHNGHLPHAPALRRQLIKQGALFQSTADTETIVHLVARAVENNPVERLMAALKTIAGAYTLAVLTDESLIGVRDPLGIRPLVLGKLGEAYILASESCGLNIIGADRVRDVEPGEVLSISAEGLRSFHPFGIQSKRFCSFEYIYFSRPDSRIEGVSVYEARKRMGAELASEHPCEGADVIVPVPDSGVPAAIGFAETSGKPFDLGIIRSHYVGRTFIQPSDGMRDLGVRLKHSANADILAGKNIVLIDDSIVRGTTSHKIVALMRLFGAHEVHMRIASPPIAYACHLGIDTPHIDNLLAHRHNLEEMKQFLDVDSLGFLSVESLYRALGSHPRESGKRYLCDACFTGDYPVVAHREDKV